MNFLGLFFAFGRDPAYGPPTKAEQRGNAESLEMQTQDQAERREAESEIPLSTSAKNRALLTNKTVWLLAIFLCFYVGLVVIRLPMQQLTTLCRAEVSIGGWAISFLLAERGGTADVGYVSCVCCVCLMHC